MGSLGVGVKTRSKTGCGDVAKCVVEVMEPEA